MSHYIASETEEKQLVLKFFQNRCAGIFVEVGANDPVNSSQTWLLEQNGWSGVLVEPLSTLCEKLRAQRKNSQVFQVACSSPDQEGEAELHVGADPGHSTLEAVKASAGTSFAGIERVKITTLDKVLQAAVVLRIDFLSIDVEGHEIAVLRGLDFLKYRPTLILIEDGLQDLSRHRFLTARGYKVVKRTHLNNWYVPRDCDFSYSTAGERLELFRKMYLSLPFRKLRQILRRQRKVTTPVA